eukprot:3828467-Amphidinium_carterae.1
MPSRIENGFHYCPTPEMQFCSCLHFPHNAIVNKRSRNKEKKVLRDDAIQSKNAVPCSFPVTMAMVAF